MMKPEKHLTELNILLADDDPDDRFFFDKALKEIPVATKLIMVNDGEQLMTFLNQNLPALPDLLFLDLSMPLKTGYECLSEIKENVNLKYLPVVMLTTSYKREVVLEQNLKSILLNMGARDYIRKPNDFDELKNIILQSLLDTIKYKELTDKK